MSLTQIQSLIFGFGFRMRSGKDSCVSAILEQRSDQYDVRQYSFAKALKLEVNAMAKRAGGMRRLFLYADFPHWVKWDPFPPMDDPYCPLGKQRLLLQFWGVHRREQDSDYWIKRVAEQIAADAPELALISDLRFLNEFDWIKTYGDCVRVDRPGLPLATHVSETELANVPEHEWNAIIHNDGTLEELKEKALQVFDRLMNVEQGVSLERAT